MVDARTRGKLGEAVVRLPLTGCTADPGGRPGWVAASSAGLTWLLQTYCSCSHYPAKGSLSSEQRGHNGDLQAKSA